MPDLDTSLHTDMLRYHKRQRGWLPVRLWRAIKRELVSPYIYGTEWGDTETVEPLIFIRNNYVLPYVKSDKVAVEIGCGGGRWTRYLKGFAKLYVVDYHEELLKQLRVNFRQPNIVCIKNNGADFPNIPPRSVDYLFSFGTFVHLDTHLIEAYLANMRAILKPDATALIHYSDKNKIMGRNPDFSDNTPEKMRKMVLDAGYTITKEDTTTMWHSGIIMFTPGR
jgi:SAM-dependent methyltransferase